MIALAISAAEFWQAPSGVLGWLGVVALTLTTIAGAVAAARSILRTIRDGRRWTLHTWQEHRRRDDILDQLLSPDGWPNGARSIIEAQTALYDRLAGVEGKVDDVLHQIESLLTEGGRRG